MERYLLVETSQEKRSESSLSTSVKNSCGGKAKENGWVSCEVVGCIEYILNIALTLVSGVAMDDLYLWLRYPLMIKYTEGNNTCYKGLINVNMASFTLVLCEKIIPFESEIHSIIASTHPKDMVTILDKIVKVISPKVPTSVSTNNCGIYRHVLREYSEFTGFYLNLKSSCLASDLSKIDIAATDEWNREHVVEVSVNHINEEGIFKITTDDLPQGRNAFKESSSLKGVMDQFLVAIEALQPFFNLMDVLDKNCWVVDPAEPKRRCTYRRINISENVSALITVDPYNVASIPDIKFLGPERLVSKYRNIVNENLEHWTSGEDVYLQLLNLLGLDNFPQKSINDRGCSDLLKENGDCSICFCLRLNGRLPEVVCKNTFCENYYHTECLYEWLVSVNARRFFDEVVGQCPNCEKNISCPAPR
ncbi:hypothetical protein NQ318_014970 [Aromia moschata]|uniref:E3 ubiquitin-protein ligase FANCL n=1 Tax=Aromia moschata TaxID=1265417 RepID=A0AAV8YX08_9CUCU|nr:hypothetical protein NQ318_014970 [Aromia moschata]